jgi:hypothetical protein
MKANQVHTFEIDDEGAPAGEALSSSSEIYHSGEEKEAEEVQPKQPYAKEEGLPDSLK